MPPIRAVFFDLDDTLCDSRSAFTAGLQAALAAIRARHPGLTDDDLLQTWRSVTTSLFADFHAERFSMEEVRTLRFRRLLDEREVPDDDFADEVDLLLGRTQLDVLKLFADITVIEELRRRSMHVGIITNGAADRHPDSQRSKVERLGLLPRVDSFFVSDETGYRKPDPRMFLSALQIAGCAPSEALFVGDSPENDVAGANRAGIGSVLLLRSGDVPVRAAGEMKPDYMVRSLMDVGELARR